jgi:hypothetical protein
MRDKLLSVIQELTADLNRISSYSEVSTEQVVVERLLTSLGWDQYNIDEITRQYTLGDLRVDYALLLSRTPQVFIEVKRPQESDLERHQKQLLDYSFRQGVPLAVLTNGIEWWFYLALTEVSWEQRKFYTIDLSEQKPEDICDKLIDFLSKENVSSGDAIKNAERIRKSRDTKRTIVATLPKAWNQVVSDMDPVLVELLRDTTEKLCGFRPGIRDVKRFLRDYKTSSTALPTSNGKKGPPKPITSGPTSAKTPMICSSRLRCVTRRSMLKQRWVQTVLKSSVGV